MLDLEEDDSFNVHDAASANELKDTPSLISQPSSPSSPQSPKSDTSLSRDSHKRKAAEITESSVLKRVRLDLEEEEDDLPNLDQFAADYQVNLASVNLGRSTVNNYKPVTGTTFDGKTVILRRNPVKTVTTTAASHIRKTKTSLIETPIYRLLEEIEDDKQTQTQPQPQPQPLTAANLENADQKHKVRQSLWTDKYKPSKFVDLLGDDRINRAAMAWLKSWDQCVFKTVNPQQARKKSKEASLVDGADAGPTDPYGRPYEKVLLLSGPPGLGKTTLAHVLAKQAGYQVHEVNASDDRTARIVTDRIRDACESRAISLDGNIASNKPTCIVIDEIDGAGGGESGFVRTLVKFIQDGSKINANKKYVRKGQKPLMRPIICICNDLYAPVLRPLRPLAKLIRIVQPSPASVITRIRTICAAETMVADSKTLSALVTIANGDLRTCLNTLQFIKTKSDAVTEENVKVVALGLKDTGTSASVVWDHLFRIPFDRKGKGSTHNEKYVERLAKDVMTCGEYDRLIQGCFEHYLSAKFPIDGWRTIDKAMSWLAFHDRIDSSLHADRNFELLGYYPYALTAWYPLFAHITNPAMSWPKADYEAHLKRTAHLEVTEAFTKTIPLHLKSSFNTSTTATDLIPIFLRIISPDIKMIGSQLSRPEDKQILQRLCKLLSMFGLQYVQDYNEDGQLAFKLDPPIDIFVHYDGNRAADLPPPRYTVRQMIAQHMTAKSENPTAELDIDFAKNILSAYKTNGSGTGKGQPEKVALDFFGRKKLVVPVAAAASDPALPLPEILLKRAKVTYRYHEGFSNAVRLPIKIANLFDANIV